MAFVPCTPGHSWWDSQLLGACPQRTPVTRERGNQGQHLCSACPAPCTVLCALRVLMHLLLTAILHDRFYCIFFVFWGFFVCFLGGCFRATPVVYGGSQARGRIRAVAAWPTPQPQQCGIQATSVAYTAAHSNTSSLTHWARPGIELWMPVRFINCWATMGTP